MADQILSAKKLVLRSVVNHSEVDDMLLELTYACYWQTLSKLTLLCNLSTSGTDLLLHQKPTKDLYMQLKFLYQAIFWYSIEIQGSAVGSSLSQNKSL